MLLSKFTVNQYAVIMLLGYVNLVVILHGGVFCFVLFVDLVCFACLVFMCVCLMTVLFYNKTLFWVCLDIVDQDLFKASYAVC